MHIELIQHTLSTMLLDCISHYPAQGHQKECFGLVFGEQGENVVGEYTFPVGNVRMKTANSVDADENINTIVKEARKLVTTNDFVAYYHSHPYEELFEGVTDPSIGDLEVAAEIQSPMEIIFALAKNSKGNVNRPLQLQYMDAEQFHFINSGQQHPRIVVLGNLGNVITGHYKDYDFRIHAYRWTGEGLEDICLYSSEVEVNQLLREHDIVVEQLPKEAMYYVKKLEYSLRLANKEKYADKIPYLLEKIQAVGV